LKRDGEIFPILGEAAIAAELREGSLDDPAARQQDEALHVVAALDDLDVQRRDLRDPALT
jgi:hypothetical protein